MAEDRKHGDMKNQKPQSQLAMSMRPGGRGGPMRGGAGFVKGQGAKDVKKTFKRLLALILKGNVLKIIVAMIGLGMNTVATVAGSLFMETLIEKYIMPLIGEANPNFSGLLRGVLIMGAIYFCGVLFNYLGNLFMVIISQDVMRDIRNEMFRHMETLPIRYFDTHFSGDTMSRYTNDADTLQQMISQSLPQTISSLVTMAAVFVAMLIKSWYLTAFTILTIFVMLLVVKFVGGKSGTFFMKQQGTLGDVNGYIEEMINGQKVVKVFTYEEKSKEAFDKKNEELFKVGSTANKFANIFMPIMGNLGHLQYVLIAILGSFVILKGNFLGIQVGLTVGALVAFLQLSRSFTNPITQVSQQINSVAMALSGAERIFELLDEEPETDNGYVTLVNAEESDGVLTETNKRTGIWAWKHPHKADGTITYTKLTGDVRLSEVDFGYVPEKTVLHDVTLFAEPGQKIAFVGATGAGKTTITNLINRFYDIDDGKIRYDGININKIKKADLRRSLGVVLQDVHLFTGTVMDNIRYGRLDATDEECIAAAKLANAHDFITMLPNGYNTMLTGDGANLSQGQRQLLSIARVAVLDPPVMILDEATSSIDTRTESIVQSGMDRLMKGRTVFVIAHRLSTVQNSDVIMVLEKGRIIERGSHEKLISERGKYYQLYTGAFELE